MYILGVNISNLSREEILRKINNFLRENKFHQIATINPEFLLEAQKNETFKNILNNCDLNAVDGIGIKFAFWRYGKKLKTRISGADLMDEILKMADKMNLSVFLFANSEGLSTWEETRDAILKKHPNLNISGENIHKKSSTHGLLVENYEIVFCNFGAPYQEIFLNSLKNRNYAKIKIAMGVGGSFDFLTGKLKRAPVLWRKIGFEWLWRLFQQPKRFKRIYNAVIVFPIKILFK